MNASRSKQSIGFAISVGFLWAVNTIVEGSIQNWKKQQPSNQKRSVNHLAFIFSPYTFQIFLSFWKQNISDKFIFIRVVSRNDGSIELSWEIMDWVSGQTNSALYWCKLIWRSLNTIRIRVFQIMAILSPAVGTVLWANCWVTAVHGKHWKTTQLWYVLRKLITSSTGQAMRIGYASGLLMKESAVPLLFSGINWKKQSFSTVVCFSLRAVIKTDCSGWFTGTQVKTIKN